MTKHIARRFHFIRQANDDFQISLIPINTVKNTADAFTKPLGKDLFRRHKHGMGVRNVARLTEKADAERLISQQLSTRVRVFGASPEDFAFTATDVGTSRWRTARCGQCVYLV